MHTPTHVHKTCQTCITHTNINNDYGVVVIAIYVLVFMHDVNTQKCSWDYPPISRKCDECSSMRPYNLSSAKGCHTHSFCTTICDRGQNKSQRSNRNIRHSQRSSHYISLIFSIKLHWSREMSDLKPRIVVSRVNSWLYKCNAIIKIFCQSILTARRSQIVVTIVTPLAQYACILTTV